MPDYSKPAYAYRIEAIHPEKDGEFGFATACLMACMITDKVLSSSGGGACFISPEVFKVLQDPEVIELIKTKVDEL